MKPDIVVSALLALSACGAVLAAPRPVQPSENKSIRTLPLRGRPRSLHSRRYCSSSSSSSSSYSCSSSSPGSSSSSSGSSSSGSSSSGSGSSSSSSSGSGSSSSSYSSSSSPGSYSSSSNSYSSSSGGYSSSYSSSSSSSLPAGSSNGQLTESEGMDYAVDIQIGSSGTTIPIIIDTGSSDMLINTASVPSGDSSITPQGSSCYESYAGENGPSTNGMIYNANYVLVGTSLSNDFCNAPTNYTDGLLGLGFPSSNPQSVAAQTGTSPLLALQNSGVSSFAIYIGATSGEGTLTLNGYDTAYINGGDPTTFTTEQVTPTSAGHWGFPFTGWSINGPDGNIEGVPETAQAFLDSGATGIRVDPNMAESIWQSVGASAPNGAIACDASAPDIIFTFSPGNSYSIPSTIYIVHGSPTTCHVAVQPISGFGTSPQAARAAVIGNPFIKAYYSYFDIANSQIHLAPSIG